ncbi:hypothetical protein JCM14036_30960 [Desulfotomaculum defluvii]
MQDKELPLLDEVVETLGLTKKMLEDATSFLGSLIKDPLNELSHLVHDNVRYLRVKNQVRILCKAKKFFDKNGLSPKKIPVKVIVPLLENGSLEEDIFIQDKWTSLLINAADPNNMGNILISYIEILKQISPEEARILDFLYENNLENKFYINYMKEAYEKKYGIVVEQFYLYIENFFRLNIIKSCLSEEIYNELDKERMFSYTWGRQAEPYYNHNWNINTDTIKFTPLGIDFIRNCKIVDTKTVNE